MNTREEDFDPQSATTLEDGPVDYEKIGRLAEQCIKDRQAGNEFSIEHYLEKGCDVDPELLRQAIEMATVIHQVGTAKENE